MEKKSEVLLLNDICLQEKGNSPTDNFLKALDVLNRYISIYDVELHYIFFKTWIL